MSGKSMIEYWIKSLLAMVLILGSSPIFAHVHWTRGNRVEPGLTVGLYHIDEANLSTGKPILPAAGLSPDRGLLIGAPSGAGMQAAADTADDFLSPFSLQLQSAQIADSTAAIPNMTGDLTIEFWFKWDPDLTYQHLQAGLRSGARIEIARSTVHPASDTFGIAFVHGDTVSAPSFPGWSAIGEEAELDEWYHVAVTIHSEGAHYVEVLGHDVYNSGSTARFWLNGHAVGSSPFTVDITGMRVHGDSRIRIRSIEGPIKIDEVTIWKKDWSQDGTASNPFGDGRGEEATSGIDHWDLY